MHSCSQRAGEFVFRFEKPMEPGDGAIRPKRFARYWEVAQGDASPLARLCSGGGYSSVGTITQASDATQKNPQGTRLSFLPGDSPQVRRELVLGLLYFGGGGRDLVGLL